MLFITFFGVSNWFSYITNTKKYKKSYNDNAIYYIFWS